MVFFFLFIVFFLFQVNYTAVSHFVFGIYDYFNWISTLVNQVLVVKILVCSNKNYDKQFCHISNKFCSLASLA